MAKTKPQAQPEPAPRRPDVKIDVVVGEALKARVLTIAHRCKKVPSALVREIVNDHLAEYDQAGGVSRVILDDQELVSLVDEAAELLATDPESLLRRLVTEHIAKFLQEGRARKAFLQKLKDGPPDDDDTER